MHDGQDKVGHLHQVGMCTPPPQKKDKEFGTITVCSSQRDFAQDKVHKLCVVVLGGGGTQMPCTGQTDKSIKFGVVVAVATLIYTSKPD